MRIIDPSTNIHPALLTAVDTCGYQCISMRTLAYQSFEVFLLPNKGRDLVFLFLHNSLTMADLARKHSAISTNWSINEPGNVDWETNVLSIFASLKFQHSYSPHLLYHQVAKIQNSPFTFLFITVSKFGQKF